MEKYNVAVNGKKEVNGIEEKVVVKNVYAKNEGHAVWCAMARVGKMGYKYINSCYANAVKVA
jgi:hypothetical protein